MKFKLNYLILKKMIHEELYKHLQTKKGVQVTEFYLKWLRSPAATRSNALTAVRATELVKNCTKIIYLLLENKQHTILMIQDFLSLIAKELELQEIKLQSFFSDQLEYYDPISISRVEDAFRMMYPLLKNKLGESNLNDYFTITVRNIKNQIKTLNVTWLTSIDEIKNECNLKKKHKIEDIVIIYKGKKIEDTILKYTGVQPGDTLFIIWMKKKKPVYVPPPPRPAITYYPARQESPPPTVLCASAPAPDVKPPGSRFNVTRYNGSDDEDELEELRSFFS